jgi:cobalt-zinc-cadmium resistance protein CzcA
VKAEQTEGLPVMSVQIDRRAIARFGLSIADVQDVISIAVGGREAGQVFEGDRRFDLVVRLPDHVRRDISALENLPIPLPENSEEALVSPAARGRFSPAASGRANRRRPPKLDAARLNCPT